MPDNKEESENRGASISRRALLKLGGVGFLTAFLAACDRALHPLVAPLTPSGTAGETHVPPAQTPTTSTESKEATIKPAVRITGVTVPLEKNKSMTSAALSIDTDALRVKPDEIAGIEIDSFELEGKLRGVWKMGHADITSQLISGITDPSTVEKSGNITTSPGGIVFIPFVETTQTPFEKILKDKHVFVISPRNELTGENPSVPRDFYQGTKFTVSITSGDNEVRVFEAGPYR